MAALGSLGRAVTETAANLYLNRGLEESSINDQNSEVQFANLTNSSSAENDYGLDHDA